MKALKEKRISLRSLWRRGLVILSLFALVFASCGESDSPGDDSGGAGILRIKVIQGPQNDQYFGMPVDLEGAIIEVYYNNGKHERKDVHNSSEFTAWPRIVTGFYYDNLGFVPMPGCIITYKNFFNADGRTGSLKDFDSYAEFEGDIWYIDPTNTRNIDGYGPIFGVDEGLYDVGLHVVGRDRVAKKAYVDDDEFDLSGLEIEAEYILSGTTQRNYQKISLGDTSWRILPDYQRNADGSSRGFLYITVGEDIYGFMNTVTDGAGKVLIDYFGGNNKGVTASVPLDTVYTVSSIDLASPPEFEDYFYWQENTSDAWVDRLGEDAQLVVKYTGGAPEKRIRIADLWKNRKIWYNANPGYGGADWTYPYDAYMPEDGKYINYDFWIVPIQYPLTVKANKDPGITLYYRGYVKKIPVDVFTTLQSIQAVSKDGQEIRFNPGAVKDNDKDGDMPGSGGLAAKLNVTATYQAYNDPTVTSQPLTLMYKGELAWQLQKDYGPAWRDGSDLRTEGGEYIPYYTFSKSTTEIGPEDADASYYKGFEKWKKAVDKWDRGKGSESFQQAVTIGHKVDEWELYGFDNVDTTSEHDHGGLEYLYYGIPQPDGTMYATVWHNYDGISGEGVDNFRWNVKSRFDDRPGYGYTYWQWVDRSLDYTQTPDAFGNYPPLSANFRDNVSSGVKSKVKTDKPVITWVVAE